MNKLNKRKCKNCGIEFQKVNALQSVCGFNCSVEWAKKLEEKKKSKDWRTRKAEKKEKLKTLSDYKKELQTVFNKWIRLTKEKKCISCNKDISKEKFDAGHYRTAGGHPELRYEPLNVWNQCVKCNRDLHGNLIEYRKNLVKKIGTALVEYLEEENQPKKYTKEELKELIKHYKEKIKTITKN